MKKSFIILSLILLTIIAIAQDEYIEWVRELSKDVISEDGDDYHGLIVKQANEKWGTDYEMVAYEIKKQCKAFYEFLAIKKPNGMVENTFLETKTRAMMKWTKTNSDNKMIEADWAMVLYETKKQIKAYLEIF